MSGGFHDAAVEGLPVDSADFVIVGSGAGGGAAARVLSEAGYSVVVLEDGPLVPKEKLGFLAAESMHLLMRNGGQMAALGRSITPILQARCVGGTTFVNSAIVWRLPDHVLHRWWKDHGLQAGLPAGELDEAYQTIERDMSVRPVGDAIATGSDLKLGLASKKLGYDSRPLHRYDKDCKGSGRCLHGCPNEAKQSTAINYLRRAVAAEARVVAHAKAHRVLTEQGRATTVEIKVSGPGRFDGKKLRIRARRAIVVCGSVFGSPQLLRRSGLGTGNDALGNHFMAHPGLAIGGIYPEPVHMWSGAAQGYESFGLRDTLGVKIESINVPPEVAASRLPGAGARLQRLLEKLPNLALWSLAVRADAEGTVRESWLTGDSVRYSLLTSDVERVRAAVKKIAKMQFVAGASEVVLGIYGLPDVLTSPDQLDLIDQAPPDPRIFSMLATHLFGTCRAGTDPQHSVVDPNLKVHGVNGLYVMDASVFPSNTGVNPQHSIMAIATVAARRLAAETRLAPPRPEERAEAARPAA